MYYDLEYCYLEMMFRGQIRRLEKVEPSEYDGWCSMFEKPREAYYRKLGKAVEYLEWVLEGKKKDEEWMEGLEDEKRKQIEEEKRARRKEPEPIRYIRI